MTLNPYESPQAHDVGPSDAGRTNATRAPFGLWLVTGWICLAMPTVCAQFFVPRIIHAIRGNYWHHEVHAQFWIALFILVSAVVQLVAVLGPSRIAARMGVGLHYAGAGFAILMTVLAILVSFILGDLLWRPLVAGPVLLALYVWAWRSMRQWRKELTPAGLSAKTLTLAA